MKMTRENWEGLKDDIARIYEGRLVVLHVGKYEDDGITLLPIEDTGMGAPFLTVERRTFDCGYESVCVSVSDKRRDTFNTLPLTDMSAVYARMTVEFAVSCLFGIDDEEETRLACDEA